ncbi:hypothetical protein [Nocardia phage NBR1]|uniref:hypothetical protein n=1 Tax=Nocardia phage NBR1 TaxID=1109711 RepID=UPI00023EEDF3|nr:hypothetical protein NoPhNBR1_gp48 [Nocardia phage NBR1]AEV52261.1 hypothetical protein [Nocardia phage NBR1]
MARRKQKRRDFEVAEQLGWVNEGRTKSGHYRLRHPVSGQVYIVAGTGGRGRGTANAVSALRRMTPA